MKLAAAATSVLALAASAQDAVPTCAMARVAEGAESPRIDGALDDVAWQTAAELGALVQVLPVEGAAPSEASRVLLCYDANAIYFAFDFRDGHPELLRATQMQRDANLDPDERVEILIDPFLDRRNAFWFQIGAAGSLGDALITRNGSNFNKQWDGIWFGEARITQRGWQAEIAIPFATLNFDPDGTAWGFNLRRHIRRKDEEVRWAGARYDVSFFSIADCGTLTGLQGLKQGLGLDLKPFGVLRSERDHATEDTSTTGDVGFDAFYKLSPNTKLSLSVNTDFAETEVDARRVNLTRFPLFFPEKRDFFLEDSGVFQFGGTGNFEGSNDAVPFFSRRIGLDSRGEAVPLLGAAKLTGQTDSYSFGLLDVQTDETSSLDGTNLFAARFSKNVFEQSDVGVIATNGNPRDPDADASTYGLDVNLRTDEFLGDQNLRSSSYVLRTDNELGGPHDASWGTRLTSPNYPFDWNAGYAVIEEDFAPELGFAPRTGIRKSNGGVGYGPRLNNAWAKSLEFSLDSTWITDTGGETETFEIEAQPFGIELPSGDEAGIELIRTREVLDSAFAIQPGVAIAAGDYVFDRVRVEAVASDKRDFSGELSVSAGEFFDGDSVSLFALLAWRGSRYFLCSTEYERDDVDLPAGDFVVNVVRARTDVLFSPRLSWTTTAQWDDASERIGLNSRLWWILRAGSEAFLVLNRGWEHDSPHIAPVETELALKFGYTFRF